MSACFHCGDALPSGAPRYVLIDSAQRPVCCPGCEAVAQLIAGSGLEQFYRYRERTAPDAPPARPDTWTAFDREAVQQAIARTLPDGSREATIAVEGMYCAACAWLIERVVGGIAGVGAVEVNPASGRATLRWDPQTVALSRLLSQIEQMGYRPRTLAQEAQASAAAGERRLALKRLAVAGLGMMQVMMYAVGLYAGAIHEEIDDTVAALLRVVSLLITTPVVFYSAALIFRGAWNGLRVRRPGMDVPVALAIGGAFAASVWNTLIGSGEVYFDSVAMFVFFLLSARYFEMTARHRAADAGDALARTLPATAARLAADGSEERVALAELRVGDRLRVRPGEVVPADGRVIAGQPRLDESLLTGEFQPVARGSGEAVLGGSLNTGTPFDMQVRRLGRETLVANIARLLERAQSQRPRLVRGADRVARWFVTAVLMLAAGTAVVWWQIAPAEAFAVTLAVLVVTCPCALSLAMPTALTAGTARLARAGILVARPGALEALARTERVILDKTGTLTTGELTLCATEPVAEIAPEEAFALATALEAHSEHPIGRAFQTASAAATPGRGQPRRQASVLRVEAGQGVEGCVDGRQLRIGRPDWATGDEGGARACEASAGRAQETVIALGDGTRLLALFRLADAPRPEAARAIAELRALGIAVEIASGDGMAPVGALARSLDVTEWRARQTPDSKLARLRQCQARGERVVMVGDGINDAPVLGGADVSIAMGSGSALAQSSSDLILTGQRLADLPAAVRLARRTLAVMRQNMAWAIGYNTVALPLAVTGQLAPWMAAAGMSASSLIVVGNAMRLGRGGTRRGAVVAPAAGKPAPEVSA